jgi:hypothetical protein
VPFFGKPATSVRCPAMIARAYGARIWMARCVLGRKESRFKIEIKELKFRARPTRPTTCAGSQREMQKQFEAWVRETPSSGCGATAAGGRAPTYPAIDSWPCKGAHRVLLLQRSKGTAPCRARTPAKHFAPLAIGARAVPARRPVTLSA